MATQILAGIIQLEDLLAKGVHSTIYRCTDLRTGNAYVCKKVPYGRFTQLEEDALTYELFVAHNVTHTNVVPFLDIIHDKEQKTYYLIMPFYRFHDLGTVTCQNIEKGEYSTEINVWMILVQCLLALDHFDTKVNNINKRTQLAEKFVFGDIRPTSIYSDLQGNTSINTFRLSKHLLTARGDVLGLKLIPYMAPERLRGQEYDGRADVWSLGCTIYEVCVRSSLFHGTKEDVLDQIYNLRRPVRLPQYSDKLEEIVNLLLEPAVESRPFAGTLLSHPIIIEYRQFYDKQLATRQLSLGYKLPEQGTCKICGGNGLDCCELVRLEVANSKKLSYIDENGKIVYVSTLEEQRAGVERVADKMAMDRVYSVINPDSRKANYFNIKTVTKEMVLAKQKEVYKWESTKDKDKEKTEPSIVMRSIQDRYKYNEQRSYFPKERYCEAGTYMPPGIIPLRVTKLPPTQPQSATFRPQAPVAYNCVNQWSYNGADTIDFMTQYTDSLSQASTLGYDRKEAPSIVSNTESSIPKHDNAPSYNLIVGSNGSTDISQSTTIDELLFQVKSASPPAPMCRDFISLTYANSPTPPPQHIPMSNVPVTKVVSYYEPHPPSTQSLHTSVGYNIDPANVSVQSVKSTYYGKQSGYNDRDCELWPRNSQKTTFTNDTFVSSVVPSKAPSIHQGISPISMPNSTYRDSVLIAKSVHPDGY